MPYYAMPSLRLRQSRSRGNFRRKTSSKPYTRAGKSTGRRRRAPEVLQVFPHSSRQADNVNLVIRTTGNKSTRALLSVSSASRSNSLKVSNRLRRSARSRKNRNGLKEKFETKILEYHKKFRNKNRIDSIAVIE